MSTGSERSAFVQFALNEGVLRFGVEASMDPELAPIDDHGAGRMALVLRRGGQQDKGADRAGGGLHTS